MCTNENYSYIRLIEIIGIDNFNALREKNVLLFGLGGVGGSCAEALVRSGIKNMTIVDGDVVDRSNINRQIIATEETIGTPKSKAMKNRLQTIDKNVNIKTVQKYCYPDEDWEIAFRDYDYIVDAIDTMSTKLEILKHANENEIPIIAAMGFANKMDPTKIELAEAEKTHTCPLARKYRASVKKMGIKHVKVVFSTEKPIETNHSLGSSSFVPPAAGLVMASHVVRKLINGYNRVY